MPSWLTAFIARWGIRVVGGAVISALLAGGAWLYLNNLKTKEYVRGYNQARIDYPQNVYNGNTTVNQIPKSSMFCFPLKLGRLGVGVCKD